MMRVRVTDGPPPGWSAAEKLFEGSYFLTNGPRNFDIAPDGRRFLMLKQSGTGPPRSFGFVLVQHWFEELRRLAPAN